MVVRWLGRMEEMHTWSSDNAWTCDILAVVVLVEEVR